MKDDFHTCCEHGRKVAAIVSATPELTDEQLTVYSYIVRSCRDICDLQITWDMRDAWVNATGPVSFCGIFETASMRVARAIESIALGKRWRKEEKIGPFQIIVGEFADGSQEVINAWLLSGYFGSPLISEFINEGAGTSKAIQYSFCFTPEAVEIGPSVREKASQLLSINSSMIR